MEDPNIPHVLEGAGKALPRIDPPIPPISSAARRIISTSRPGMAQWREKLFAVMSRNATTATAYFGIPPDRVVELGEQIEIP